MTSCPVYREAREAAPWDINGPSAVNMGLLFDKFGHAWENNAGKWEFDKTDGSWLRNLPGRLATNSNPLLKEAANRQFDFIRAMGGEVVILRNVSRFVTGMGRQHPLENGFTWHHTLGVPYLPGSGVKGVLRAWLRENGAAACGDDGKADKIKRLEDLLGRQEEAAGIILLDMLPLSVPKLVVEIMTPHYGPYYEDGRKAPGDWHSPTPITFLAVEKGLTWQVGILPASGNKQGAQEQLREIRAALIEAFDWLGAGAKTAVGFGQFREDAETAGKRFAEAEQRRKQAEADALQAEAARKREEELSKLPPDVAELKRLVAAWGDENDKILAGIEAYRQECPSPGPGCVEILKNLLESMYKDIWANPHATSGKKKKPTYKARPKNLVLWLKSLV